MPELLDSLIDTQYKYMIYWCEYCQKIHLDFIGHIQEADSITIGYLILRVDPYKYLYPVINSWPHFTVSGETELVQRVANNIVFVNDVRKITNSALKIKESLADTNRAAVNAARGNYGLFRGYDYRQEKVLAYSIPIKGSDWILVTKQDYREVNKPIRELAIAFGVILFFILLFLGIILLLMKYSYQKSYVTKLYESEMERKALVSHFKHLISNANDIIILANEKGRIVDANNAACNAYQRTRQEMLSLDLKKLGKFNISPRNIEKTVQIGVYESTHTRSDGTTFPVEINEQVMEIEDKKYIQAIIRDITERKVAEQKLIENEKTYRDLVETINDVIFKVTIKGLILYVSPVIKNFTGYDPEELIGNSFLNYVYGEDKEMLMQKFKNLDKEENRVQEYRFVKKDGEVCWVRTSTSTIYEDNVLVGESGILTDITKQKIAELELIKSEQLHKSIINASPDIILICSLEGKIQFVSPRVIKMYGYKDPSLLINHSIFDFLSPNEHDKAKMRIGQMYEGTNPGNTEYKGIKADGSFIEIETTGEFIKDSSGKPVQMLILIRDITHRKDTERKLVESEALYRSIIGVSPDMISIVDFEGRLTFGSPKLAETFGYNSIDELIGKPVLTFFAPEEHQRVKEEIGQLFKGEQLGVIEYTGVKRNGTLINLEINSAVITDSNGVPTGFVSVSRDITERKTAEKLLQESRLKFQQMVETINDAIYEVGIDGIVTYVSPAIERIVGYKPEEVIGKNFFGFMFPDDRPILLQALKRLGKRDYSYLEYRYIKRDGSINWVRSSTNPMYNDKGEIIGGRGSLTNINEIKITAEQLSKSQERYKSFFEGNNSTILILDSKNGQIHDANPAACSYYGWSHEEICKMNISQINIMPQNQINSVIKRAEKGSAKHFIFKHRLASGEIRDVEVYTGPVQSDETTLIYALIHDITERKLAEEKLNQEKEKLDKIAASVPGVICSFHQSLSGQVSMPYASPAVKKVYGFDPHEIANDMTPIMSRILPEDIEHVIYTITQSAQNMSIWKDEYRYQHPDKGIIWIEGNSMPVKNTDGTITWHGFVQDITERKEADKNTKIALAKYKTLFESFPMGITVSDKAGNIIETNSTAETLLGISSEEHLNRKLSSKQWKIIRTSGELMPAEEYASVRALRDQQKIENVEMGIVKQDNSVTWLNVTAAPVPLGDYGVVVTYSDITERKAAEERMRLLSQRQEAILDAVPEIIMEVDNNQVYTWGNHTGLEFFGDDVVGHEAAFYFEGEQTTLQAVQPIFRGEEQVFYIESWQRRKDGQKRLLAWWCRTLKDSNGNVVGALSSARDITDIKQVENEIIRSQEKYKSLIDSSDAAITMMDFEGRYIFLNEIAAKPFGLTSEQLTGVKAHDLFPPDQVEQMMADIRLVKSTKEGFVKEIYVDLAGKPAWFRTSIQPVKNELGEVTSVMMHSTNMTESKLAEEKIAQSEKKYKSLFFESPVAYLIIKDGLFVECNKASELLIGGGWDDIVGKSPAEISPEFQPNGKRSVDYAKELVAEAFEKGSKTFEWVHKRADGSEFLATINLSSTEYGGAEALFVVWSDITQQRKAEEEVLKFKTITSRANYGVAIAGLDGTLLYSNDYFAKMHGYKTSEILGRNLSMLHSGNQLESVKESIAMLQKEGEFNNLEIWRTRKDGSAFPSLMNAILVFDEMQRPLFMSATAIDITEIKQVQDALVLSESRYSEVAAQSRTVIWEVDKDGLYTVVSPIAELVYGYRPEDLIGKKYFYDLHPAELKEEFKSAGLALISNGSLLKNFDNPIETSTGGIIWVSTNGAPLYDDKGNIVGYRGADIDITQRKLAEERVLKSEEKLNFAQELVKMGSWEHDFINRKHTWSKNYFRLLGLDPDKDKMSKDHLMRLIHPDDLETFAEKERELVENRKPLGFDFRFVMPDNSIKWIHEVVMPIYTNKQLVALSGVNIDITERKQKDEEINKLSVAVEQSPVMVVITDLDGNIEYLNHEFEQVTGYTRQEAVGRNPRILKSGLMDSSFYKNMWNTITADNTWQGELINKKKNGEIYWEQMSITPIHGEKNKIVNFLAIKQDITKRKEAEQEILNLNANLEQKVEQRTAELTATNEELEQEIEERSAIEAALVEKQKELENFFDVSLDLLCIANMQGQFLKLNRAWSDLLGYNIEDLEKRQFMDFVHPEDIQSTIDAMSKLGANMQVLKFVNRYRANDGSYKYIEWHSVPAGDLIYAAARDVTERKRKEDFELEVLDLSTKLTGLPVSEIPGAINLALERIGKFMNADRAFILEINNDGLSTNMTYEWSNESTPSQIEHFQKLPLNAFPVWWDKLNSNQPIIVEDIDTLDSRWGDEKEKLRTFGNKAMLVIPMFLENKLIGCGGLGSLYERKETSDAEINILRIWSRMLTSLINNLRAEELLELTRKNYESFFNTLDDFLWVLDKEGNIIHFNNTALKRLEYSYTELVGKSIIMVHPPEKQVEAKNQLNRLLSGSDETFSIPLMTKSGKTIPVETKAIQGFWNGQPIIFKISKDITNIKLSEEKFSAAFKNGSAMMAISYFNEGNYIDVNNAFLETIGYSRMEVIGKSNKQLGLFVESNLRDKILGNLNNDIPVRKVEALVRVKDGSVKTILVSADSIIVGNKRCLLTVSIDITDRKKAEEELQIARQEAEKANVAKSEFLSRMSHELRTPMNSILGFAQLLEMGELNPGQKKGVNHIMKSGKHLLDLINEVLDISRIEAGRLSLSLEPIQLNSIVVETMDIVRPMANSRKISLVMEDSPDSQLFVKSDRQRLKQVLLNIINNAVKYNREGGSITIKAEKRDKNELGYIPIRISILDTGIGIAKESIDSLFKPFERVGAEKTTTEGTGLGLAVVKKLVEAMGGLLGVESVLGEGSTFWVELPLTESQKERVEKSGELTDVDKNLAEKAGTILYIEDNIPNIELVEQILSTQKTKINLITNMNGKEAVDLANRHKPDLILLDLNLPDIHGTDVLKLLQVDNYAKNIPVVVISADAMPQQLDNLMKLGAKDYLTKPLDVKEFLAVVNKFIINM